MFAELYIACGQPACDAEQSRGREQRESETNRSRPGSMTTGVPSSPQTTGQSAKYAGPSESQEHQRWDDDACGYETGFQGSC